MANIVAGANCFGLRLHALYDDGFQLIEVRPKIQVFPYYSSSTITVVKDNLYFFPAVGMPKKHFCVSSGK